MTVYIIFGEVAYEGRSILRVYTDKIKAERFLARLLKYQQAKPEYLEAIEIDPCEDNNWYGDQREATEEERMARMDEIDEWSRRHPAGDGYYDEFYIEDHKVTQ